MTIAVEIIWDFELCGADIGNVNTDALCAQFRMINPDAVFKYDDDPHFEGIEGSVEAVVEPEDINPLSLLLNDENAYPFYTEITAVNMYKTESGVDLIYEISGYINCGKLPSELLLK